MQCTTVNMVAPMAIRPPSSLGFDPMLVLVEDACACNEPPELVYDFIDRLLTSQLPPGDSHGASAPIPIATYDASGYSKRHKRVEQPPMVVGSPVSTIDYATDLDVMPPAKQPSSSSSSSDSGRNERSSPPRSGGVGLSRKNRPQRCSICKECGHKSRTCRLANGKGDLLAASPGGFGSISIQTATY